MMPKERLIFHFTRTENAIQILRRGIISGPKESPGMVSFTTDPGFGEWVAPSGVGFVYSEKVIRDKYGGVADIEGWETEHEICTNKEVDVRDALEILPTGQIQAKYGYGLGYPFKDIRLRTSRVWREFSGFIPTSPNVGPPLPRRYRVGWMGKMIRGEWESSGEQGERIIKQL